MSRVVWVAVAAGLFILGAALLTAGLVVELSVFNTIVHNSMKKQKVLGRNADGTLNDFTKEWAFPNYISVMNYWTFDYKNPIGILNRGIYPDMVEKGPYAYKEILKNDQIDFYDDNNTMSFAQSTVYIFDPSRSCKNCFPNDTITIPDISFVLGLNAIEEALDKVVQMIEVDCFFDDSVCEKIDKLVANVVSAVDREMGIIMDAFGVSPFVTVTVDQLIYSGYDAPFVEILVGRIFKIINELIETHIPPPPIVPIALNPENGTTDFVYYVDTGKQDYQKSGFTKYFVNNTEKGVNSDGNKLPQEWWPYSNSSMNESSCADQNLGDHALLIEGTNADYFQSFIKRTDKLPIYVDDICRSVKLTYDRDVTVQGIDGYRFILPSSEFDYKVSENCGFCSPLPYGAYNYDAGSPCMPTGLLNISACQGGAPILISKPHFYQADKIVTQFVPRFRPNYDNDETTLDIEPITGTVLSANKKLQINMFMNQYPRTAAYSILRPGAYPLIWLNESFLIDQGTVNQLKGQLFTPKKIIAIICWTAVGVGGVLMILSAVILFIQFCVHRKVEKKDE